MANGDMDRSNSKRLINDVSTRIDVSELAKNWERVKRDRVSWETKWNQIQDYVFPSHEDYASRPRQSNQNSTSEKQMQNYTSSVVGKVNRLVSQFSSMLVDPSTDWFHLRYNGLLRLANNARIPIGENDNVQRYCTICKENLYRLFSDPSSNFYPSTYALHFDWFTLGNGCRNIMLRGDNSRIQFDTVSLSDVFVETSGYGDIKNIYRRYNLSASQAYDIWRENLHPSDLQLINNNFSDSRTKEYVEVCIPNPFLGEQGQDMPYLTVAFDVQNKHLLSYGYHARSPYVFSRFYVKSGEAYGHTFLWDAIPDIATINKLSKLALIGAGYMATPILMVKDATSFMASHIHPGAVIQGLNRDNRSEVQPLNIGTNEPFLMQYYQFKLNDLDEALLVKDMFLPETPGMTATEVNERRIQMSNRIRPMLIRLEKEDLNNTILRALSLMSFLGMLPSFPYKEVADDLGMEEELLAQLMPNPIDQIDISFSGQMNHMQRLNEVRNNNIFLQEVRLVAEIQSFNSPIVERSISLDAFLRNSADVYDISPSVVMSAKESAKIQAQQEQSRQMAQEMQQLEMQQRALENSKQQLENDRLSE